MDYLINKQWYYHQVDTGYHVNNDTIFLAGFINARHKDRILDIGCGSGALMILVHHMFRPFQIDGIEIDPVAFEYAKLNISWNKMDALTTLIYGDINTYNDPDGYDVIISNPPYYPCGGTRIDPSIYQGRYQTHLSFDQLITSIHSLLRPKGTAYIVYPVHGLNQIMACIHAYGMGITRVRLYYPSEKKDASIMALAIRHGQNQHCRIEKPWQKETLNAFCNSLKTMDNSNEEKR